MDSFQGFPRETPEFFEKLKQNNSKVWFQENRNEYDEFVKRPSEQFVIEMGEMLKHLAPRINAIPKVNQSLFRINRDTRFSHDKSPYKTNLGIWFWEGTRKRMECPGFYFHLGDGKLMLGTGIHIFSKGLLKLYRDAVSDKKNALPLEKVVNEVSEKGYMVVGKHYKRFPRGYDASHGQAEFLLYNGLTAMIEEDIPKEFYSLSIIEYAFSHFKNMYPIHDWLTKAID
ncbi:MAG: DUF2461 domain-containing protein [Thermodesulfobacteriota bacterium]|nr:DUF2461 domain-containing protein [Thermodesulfobacteriota bacterium]